MKYRMKPVSATIARSDEQQFMSTAIQKNVHGEVRRTAIYTTVQKNYLGVDPDDERSKRQIDVFPIIFDARGLRPDMLRFPRFSV